LLFRDRTPDFFVQAYFVGPKNVNPQDASTLWLKYEETLSKYEEERKRYNFFDPPLFTAFESLVFLKIQPLLSRIEFDTSILKDDRFLSFNFSIKSIIT
jgi:hypothetical protein